MLTMWLSFTMSEVRGIRVCDIKDGIMTINQVVVDVRGMPVAKAAGKEFDRNRALAVPPYIMRLIEDTPAWKNGDGYIITASGESIRGRFRRLCAKADFAGHLQGIPKKQKSPHQGAYFIFFSLPLCVTPKNSVYLVRNCYEICLLKPLGGHGGSSYAYARGLHRAARFVRYAVFIERDGVFV